MNRFFRASDISSLINANIYSPKCNVIHRVSKIYKSSPKIHFVTQSQNEIDCKKLYESHGYEKITNMQETYTRFLFKQDNVNYFLRGRIDGLSDNKVVEIKSRENKIHDLIFINEYIQLQAYMHLTGYKESNLIEHHSNLIAVHDCEFSPCMWNDFILNHLRQIAIDM